MSGIEIPLRNYSMTYGNIMAKMHLSYLKKINFRYVNNYDFVRNGTKV